MCYSALVKQDWKRLERTFGARADLASFERLFVRRLEDATIRIPKGMELGFHDPVTAQEQRIYDAIAAFHSQRTRHLEEGLFAQKKRLGDAERKLQVRQTKAARDSQRIASDKVQWHLSKLAEIRRTELDPEDGRIFPFWYAPVVIAEGSELVIKPMRYHCRPAGKPASYDRRFEGCYNARRDNLTGFWKHQFTSHHAIVAITGFYENVAQHDFEKRQLQPGEKERNVVLQFLPKPEREMHIACLWSHWSETGSPDLDSFAAITDEPPPEIAAAGHDRCVIPLTQEGARRWLSPAGSTAAQLDQLLDDRERPYYEHRLAA